MSGQRNRVGTKTAGLKARAALAPMSVKREQRLRSQDRYQYGSAFARPSLASAGANRGRTPGPPCSDLQVNEVAKPGQRRPKNTGFSDAVKLLARARAGNGDPHQALCEGCGIWLGRYGGQVQHIVARMIGGSRKRNVITNAALLCGTSLTGCHGLCESRDEHMRAMGFWRKSTDKRVPLMLHGEQSGVLVWLTPEGGYRVARPGAEAA